MKPKRYNTHYARLSNLILSMSEDQQAKLLDLACRVQKSENHFANSNHTRIFFTYGFLAAWGLVTIILIIFSVT